MKWTEILKISKSQLTTYLQCPRKYKFQYVEGRPWEFLPSALLFGRAIHEAIALFYVQLKEEGKTPSSEELINRFHSSWEEGAANELVRYTAKENEEDLRQTGEKILKLFREKAQPRRILGVEMPFTVDLVHPDTGEISDVKLIGYLDLVEEDDDGHPIVVETKTAAKKYSDRQGNSQLNGFTYAYALKQMGLVSAEDSLLFRYDILTKTKTPAFQQIFFVRDSSDDHRFLRQIHEVLHAIENEVFFANYGWWCDGCPFQTACFSSR